MPPNPGFPPELLHLVPMSGDTAYILGVIGFFGTGDQDLIWPSMIRLLVQQSHGLLLPWQSFGKHNYPHLVNDKILKADIPAVNFTVYNPKYDQAGFLECFSFDLKEELFLAATRVFEALIPQRPLDGTMFLHWTVYRMYGGHIKSLALHWDGFEKEDKVIQVNFEFVTLLHNYADYEQEMGEHSIAILITDIAFRVLKRCDFGTRDAEYMRARLLSTKGIASVQIGKFETAKETLRASYRLFETLNAGFDNLELVTTQVHLAFLAAAQGEYDAAITLSWNLWKQITSPHFNADDRIDARRILRIKLATMVGQATAIVGHLRQARKMIDDAAHHYNDLNDSPILHRAVLHAYGEIYRLKGRVERARSYFEPCVNPLDFADVMSANRPDEERTVSVFYRLAVMDLSANHPGTARMKVRSALRMCHESRSGSLLPWKGRLELVWAKILRTCPEQAEFWKMTEGDSLRQHEEAAQQAAADLGVAVVDDLVKDEQFAELVPWDMR